MTSEFLEGFRVRHIRDGLVGTVADIQQPKGPISPVATYGIRWDNGSFESRVHHAEITGFWANPPSSGSA